MANPSASQDRAERRAALLAEALVANDNCFNEVEGHICIMEHPCDECQQRIIAVLDTAYEAHQALRAAREDQPK